MTRRAQGAHAAVAPGAGLPVIPVLIAVAVILAGVLGAAYLVITAGPSPAPPAGAPGGSGPESGTPGTSATADPDDAPTSPEEAAARRYDVLAAALAVELDDCRREVDRAAERSGAVDRRVCAVGGATLELTTYADRAAFTAARGRAMEPRVGSLLVAGPTRSLAGFDPDVRETSAPATIYWDDAGARQSALLTGARTTTWSRLAARYRTLQPSVDLPRDLADEQLREFAETYELTGCRRTPAREPGVAEAATCAFAGFEVRLVRFAENRSLEAFRATNASLAASTSDAVADFWYHETNGEHGRQRAEPERGKVYGYTTGKGLDEQAVLYVDDVFCGCALTLHSYRVVGATDPIGPRDLYNRVY